MMKKIFILFTIIFINSIYSQKIDCWKCSGRGKVAVREWIICSNCKDWSSSYKSKMACNTCKDHRGRYTAYHDVVCNTCDGSGHDYEAEKEAKYNNSEEGKRQKKELLEKFNNDLRDLQKERLNNHYEYADPNIQGYYDNIPMPTKDELKKILLQKRTVSGINNWNFDYVDEFKSFNIYSAKIWGDGNLNIKAIMDLEDNTSKNKYNGDISFVFSFNANEQKWNFYYIKEGKVENKNKLIADRENEKEANKIAKEESDRLVELKANRNPVFVDIIKYATKELTKSKYEFNFKKPLTVDFFDNLLTDRKKEYIGLTKLKTINNIKVKCEECDEYFRSDGSGGYENGAYSIKISGDGGTITLDKIDGERFQIAIDFFDNLISELHRFGQ